MMYEIEEVSSEAIDRALRLIERPRSVERTYKTTRDYATYTDFLIEDELRAWLKNRTPELGFEGEERGRTGDLKQYWCLDPVDGTTNFSRGVPNYGIALALIMSGVPSHGEIALPAHRERYRTSRGRALMNNQTVRASNTNRLCDALVSIGDFATGSGSTHKNTIRLNTLSRLIEHVGRVRMLGSAATDFAWLAAGRLDAVLIHSNKPWDVAAGIALAQAAGAIVTHHDGSQYSLDGPDVLAASPALHSRIVALLRHI